jgi:hypothetical protein
MAVRSSFTQPHDDKRSSANASESSVVVDGHSRSSVAIDGRNYEQNSNYNNFSDEAKNKYDELHRIEEVLEELE